MAEDIRSGPERVPALIPPRLSTGTPDDRGGRLAEVEQRPGDDKVKVVAQGGERREHHQRRSGQRQILQELDLLHRPALRVAFLPEGMHQEGRRQEKDEQDQRAKLMLNDPFRRLDRLAEQVLGTVAHPAAMPMDAWREGDEFVVAVDLPGVEVDSITSTWKRTP